MPEDPATFFPSLGTIERMNLPGGARRARRLGACIVGCP